MTEQIIENAKLEAQKIIEDAKKEANRILSESALLKAIEKEALKIKEKTFNEIKLAKIETQPIESIFKYESCEHLWENLWKVQNFDTQKFALFHSENKQLTEFKYSMIERFEGVADNHFLIGVFDEYGVNGQFGILNDKGEEIIPMIYDSTENALEQYKKLV